MPGDLVPAASFSHESWVKNSRFIAHIGPADSVAEAKSFISRINQLHSDATHNVPVYLLGFGSSTLEHASDDGEPAGTAGRPVLAVLKGSGLGDAVLVITRYFGGTKLGTGGLVRAYSAAARSAVELVPKAIKTPAHQVSFSIHYRLFEQVKRLIQEHRGTRVEEEFKENVFLRFTIPSDDFEVFNNKLLELTNGEVSCRVIDNQAVIRQPLRTEDQLYNASSR